ncbi:hypothetical protein IAT40_003033 [Kwoniella sp. CBS 6097]
MDDDFEDLLRDTGDPDVEFSSPEKTPAPKLPAVSERQDQNPTQLSYLSIGDTNEPDSLAQNEAHDGTRMDVDTREVPSENELRLAAKVAELEKDRDDAKAELQQLRARYPSHHPTILVDSSPPSSSAKTTSSAPTEAIEIPHSLIPVLAVLRNHIQELTRDNQALRSTFLGPNPPSRGSIKTAQTPFVSSPLPVPAPVAVPDTIAPGASADVVMDVLPSTATSHLMPPPATTTGSVPGGGETAATIAQSIDLEKVLDRVKELIRENEELGELVVKVGQRDDSAWERALRDSQEVISSLDADLTHHLSVVQAVREELNAYKSHFGPLPSSSSDTTADQVTAARNAPASASASTSTSAPSGSRTRVDLGSLPIPTGPSAMSKGKHPLTDSAPSTPRSHNGSTISQSGGRERDRDRDWDRAHNTDTDRDRDRDRVRDSRRNGQGHGQGQGHRGGGITGNNGNERHRVRERERDSGRSNRQSYSRGRDSEGVKRQDHRTSLSSRLGPGSNSNDNGSNFSARVNDPTGTANTTASTSSSIVTPPNQGLSILGSAAGKKTGTGGRSDSAGKTDDRAFKRRR